MNDRHGSSCIRASDAFKTPRMGAWIGIFKPNSYNIETHVSRPRLERFWRNLARWRSSTLVTRPTVKNSKFQNSQDGGSRHLEKPKNHHISAAIGAISTNFGTVKQFELLLVCYATRLIISLSVYEISENSQALMCHHPFSTATF